VSQMAPNFQGIDSVELYVGNAKQAAAYYSSVLGFRPIGRDVSAETVSYVIGQGDIRLKLTSALRPGSPMHAFLARHGEGVKDVCLAVDDPQAALDYAVRHGARIAREDPEKPQIVFHGDITCTFLKPTPKVDISPAPALLGIDHVAMAVCAADLEEFADFCTGVFGFHISHRDFTSTEWSGMRSAVVESPDGSVKFPLVAPANGKRKSQVQEFLDFNGGPGVQHIAFSSLDLPATIRQMRRCGLEMLDIPSPYYDNLLERVPNLTESIDDMRELGILADNEGGGYLLQTFTKPLQPQPTLFGELVQRKGATGFGAGNIKSLFEAVEREQVLRAAASL